MKKRIVESLDGFINESAKWDEGAENTKTFEISDDPEMKKYLHHQKAWLQGCKHCNKVVELKNMSKERQMIGNVYQSLCECAECGRPVIFDEHHFTLLEHYLKTRK